ncbi:MAG: hypothetical protein IJ313_05185 [Clostridia bacterium]|nr:hypothetical protein [Clostridia bacterium]
MFLYTDCYTKAGYAPMRMDIADGRLEAFGKGRMEQALPPDVVTLLTGGSFQLFAGRVQDRWLLRICQIPTRLRDENHRRCFINLAFESTKQEQVGGLTAFVLDDYARFADMANRMIMYRPGGYEVNRAVLEEMLAAARAAGHAQHDRTVLVPGAGGEEAFLSELPAYRKHKLEIRYLAAIDEEKLPAPIRKDDKTMKLYLYFSSPAKGYAFTCVEPETGETIAAGKQAADMLNSRISDMVLNGGMSMALFRAGGKMNLVVKKISTAGKNQRMALVIEDGEESLTRALAACALYRNEELCDAVAACMRIDPAEGTGTVDAQAVRALLAWAQQAQAPQGREQSFDKIRQSGSYAGVPYVVLVVDPTLEYFCSQMRMQVNKSMIGLLMDEGAFKALRQSEGKVIEEKTAEKKAVEKKAIEKKAVEEKAVEKESIEKKDPKPPAVVELVQDESESINLLDYKWFLPAVGGILAALILVIVLAVGSMLSKPEEPAQAIEQAPVQTSEPAQAPTSEDGAQEAAEK